MIIWGYKGYKRIRTPVCYPMETVNKLLLGILLETGLFSSTGFSHPYRRKYYVLCPVCEYGKEIENKILMNI